MSLSRTSPLYTHCFSRSITMVKPTFLVYALATVAGVQACKKTCTSTGEVSGRCNYKCTDACPDLGPTAARNKFLSALLEDYDCRKSGAAGLSCKKTAAFGSCGSHYWKCGDDC
ncbi:hypothetical protein DER44DRAFT_792588 [Fusarium oxysporum]|nr:hypothetical protein DER44DRAFT_792588 [Fusarium oxysporum]